jgi:hypothetical protein
VEEEEKEASKPPEDLPPEQFFQFARKVLVGDPTFDNIPLDSDIEPGKEKGQGGAGTGRQHRPARYFSSAA